MTRMPCRLFNGAIAVKTGWARWRVGAAAACALSGLLGIGALPAAAQSNETLRLRIVGGLAGLNQYVRHEEPFWTRDLATLSGGRYTSDIVPFDRAGLPGQEMLTLIRLGVVPFGTALLSLVAMQFPELAAPDLAGLSPDVPALRKVVTAFRPALADLLRERHGTELLAVYVYPAQVVFCREPLAGLQGLAGRKTRVSSATQADFVRALGGIPVPTPFAEIVSAIRAGSADCAITGAVSGRTIGLPQVTKTLYTLPISWGLAMFGANREAWRALPPDLREIVLKEVPKLEATIWDEAERDTAVERLCAVAGTCALGSTESLTEVRPSQADQALRRRILEQNVLPQWIARCGANCQALWDANIAPVVGIKAPPFQ